MYPGGTYRYICTYGDLLISYTYMCFPRDRIARITRLNMVYFYIFVHVYITCRLMPTHRHKVPK